MNYMIIPKCSDKIATLISKSLVMERRFHTAISCRLWYFDEAQGKIENPLCCRWDFCEEFNHERHLFDMLKGYRNDLKDCPFIMGHDESGGWHHTIQSWVVG